MIVAGMPPIARPWPGRLGAGRRGRPVCAAGPRARSPRSIACADP